MRLIFLLLIVSFSLQVTAYQQNEYLVKADKQYITNLSLDFTRSSEVIRDDILLINLTEDEASLLKKNPEVALVVENRDLHLFKTPNDLNKKLWGLNNPRKSRAAIDINAPEAWDITTGSKDVIVAVIDTGANINHDDLMDNLWENEAELNGIAGVDDDNNGYIDDIFGFDFPKNTGALGDRVGHGTHVSGTIGAKGDNSSGVVGVNWDVSLMILNMFPDRGQGQVDDAIKAIDYAVANGAQVINASWGGPAPSNDEEKEEYQLLYEAIERAGEAGVTFVAAAGNDRDDADITPMFPAAYDLDNIISVGSMDSRGRASFFSNYGKVSVDVFAPGSGITSTTANGRTGSMSGTSMASPHVAGVVALMLSVDESLNTDEIKSALINTCTPNKSLKSKSVCAGHVNAHAAIMAIE